MSTEPSRETPTGHAYLVGDIPEIVATEDGRLLLEVETALPRYAGALVIGEHLPDLDPESTEEAFFAVGVFLDENETTRKAGITVDRYADLMEGTVPEEIRRRVQGYRHIPSSEFPKRHTRHAAIFHWTDMDEVMRAYERFVRHRLADLEMVALGG